MKGEGTHDPGRNPNSYPMTDEKTHPSGVRVRVNGVAAGVFELPDDPADHRGVVSWLAQKRAEKPTLSEAGSYGYLVQAAVPPLALADAARTGQLVLRFEVDDALAGGLAVYGSGSGRYGIDPTVVLTLR
jgi:predicted transcriptional regulator